MATGGSADAHDAGFQAVEWPQKGRLMLPMLAFRPTRGSADARDAGFQAVEWPQEGRLMLMLLAFRASSGHGSVG